MTPRNYDRIHAILGSVLERYSNDQLQSAFVVVDSSGHRIRTVR